ncbi:MAG: hypothetical protein LW650_00950 [Planctomycetaceae bacterium]|jgi:hypothetical protein|nr:hypothetical protein [Phycisphaerales bacterium]MCE2652106.1 hypothetical protein [Planctomycetaceae bacterium]
MSTPIDQAVEPLSHAVAGLPWGVHAAAAGMFVAGLILWLLGRRVLQPATVLLGAAISAAVGYLLLPSMAGQQVGPLAPILGLVVGAIAGALAAALLYRPLIAALFGIVLGCAVALTVSAVLSVTRGGPLLPAAALSTPDRPFALSRVDPPGSGLGGEELPPKPTVPQDGPEAEPSDEPPPAPASPAITPPATSPKAKPAPNPPAEVADSRPTAAADQAADPNTAASWKAAGQAVGRFTRSLSDWSRRWWTSLPASERTLVGMGWLAGAAIGLVVGLVWPARAAGVITAAVGSALFLACGTWLAHATAMPGRHALELPAAAWSLIWLVASLIGIAVQWHGLRAVDEPDEQAPPPRAKRKKKAAA